MVELENKPLPDSYFDFVQNFKTELQSTISHVENVARHAKLFVEYLHELGLYHYISPEQAWDCGLHHDWGKYFIPDIINAPRKLTDEEFDVVKQHPELGLKVLEKYGIDNPLIINAVLFHHEDYTGDKGYPHGINGDKIPEIARIMTIVDVYEALYAKRPYKEQLKYETVKEIMQGMKYKFDPELLELFFDFMDEKILSGKKQFL